MISREWRHCAQRPASMVTGDDFCSAAFMLVRAVNSPLRKFSTPCSAATAEAWTEAATVPAQLGVELKELRAMEKAPEPAE